MIVGYDLNSDQDREDRRKHLELVQAVISRQAGASATAKGWSITIAAAVFGVSVIRDNWYLLALGVAVLIVFSVVDGFYLHNEQKFRDLYDAIARNEMTPFAMDLTAVAASRSKNKSYWSWSVAYFYLPLLVAGLLLTILALTNPGTSDSLHPPERTPQSNGPARH